MPVLDPRLRPGSFAISIAYAATGANTPSGSRDVPETPPNTPDPADPSPAPAAHVLNAELHTEEAETPNPSAETMAPPAEQEGPVVEDHTAGGHRTPDVIYYDVDKVGGAGLLYEFKCYPPLAVRHDVET